MHSEYKLVTNHRYSAAAALGLVYCIIRSVEEDNTPLFTYKGSIVSSVAAALTVQAFFSYPSPADML